jgi:hypothetical protein
MARRAVYCCCCCCCCSRRQEESVRRRSAAYGPPRCVRRLTIIRWTGRFFSHSSFFFFFFFFFFRRYRAEDLDAVVGALQRPRQHAVAEALRRDQVPARETALLPRGRRRLEQERVPQPDHVLLGARQSGGGQQERRGRSAAERPRDPDGRLRPPEGPFLRGEGLPVAPSLAPPTHEGRGAALPRSVSQQQFCFSPQSSQ